MTNLDCSVIGCTYNKDNSCKKESIQVGGHEARKASETACRSFAPKGTNAATTMSAGEAKKATEVSCEATTCRFNDNKKCSAKHIGIAGTHAVTNGETECGSFECK